MRDYLFNLLDRSKSLSLEEILSHILVTVIIGLIIFFSYWITHTGTIYSMKFNVSLVILTILVATVIIVIGNNVAMSLGMVGALSIVRFRTAIKDPRDTTYIFWTIVSGICCGSGDYILAAIGSAAIFLVLLVLGRIRNDNRKLLIIRGAKNMEYKIEAIVFDCFMSKVNLLVKNTTSDSVEYIYALTSKQIEKAAQKGKIITESLYKVENIECVNLVSQNDEISG